MHIKLHTSIQNRAKDCFCVVKIAYLPKNQCLGILSSGARMLIIFLPTKEYMKQQQQQEVTALRCCMRNLCATDW
jgi:hypothetical protein